MSLREQAIPIIGSAMAGLSVVLFMGMLREERPNVVFIVVDTLRADAVSNLPQNTETPHIAELAAQGVEFPLAFSHAPMTLPAHASLFSGRHPYETGVYNNGEAVPDDVPLLAETLADNGYQTAAVVSLATLWPLGRRQGLDRGFQSFDTGDLEVAPAEQTSERLEEALDSFDPSRPFFLFAHLSDPHEPYNEHAPHFGPDAESHTAKVMVDGERVGVVTTSIMSWWEHELELAPGTHTLSFQSEAAFKLRQFEATSGGAPLATEVVTGALLEPGTEILMTLTNPAETPRMVKLRAWLNDVPERDQILARYASEVSAADAAIGRLVQSLRERGLYENTLIVLTSDHGEALGEHGTIGHVVNLYDELLHVPLVVRLPFDAFDEGLLETQRQLVRHVDVTPTVLDWLGLPELEGSSGQSLLQAGDRVLVAETHPPEAPRTLMALRDSTYKLVFDPQADSFEMFRLGPDPMELDNVFSHQGHLRKTWELVLRKLAAKIEPGAERGDDLQQRLSALGY